MNLTEATSYFKESIRKTKYDAKNNRGLTFTVTLPNLLALAKKQDGKCALTGEPLEFTRGGTWYNGKNPNGCSMDRIDNTIGYEIDNIQLVRTRVNVMRGDMPLETFRNMCRAIGNSG